MHVAAERGHCKIVEYLVGKGLDIDIQNGVWVSRNYWGERERAPH